MSIPSDLLGLVRSVNSVPIRLTKERWFHVTTGHPEILDSESELALEIIKQPDVVLKGDKDELLAIKRQARKKLWFVVVYKEVKPDDGFILTAYITTDEKWLFKRKVLWNKV